ncbi:MAG: DegV family protein [candidate division FCPU426 bacterium]
MANERIAIVTDSTSDLGDAVIKGQDIFRVPLRIYFGSEEFLDRENMTPDQFYRRLQTDKQFPRTQPPNSKNFLELFQQLSDGGFTHILCLFISSQLSKTMENAQFSANMVTRVKIKLVDSKTASLGLGFLCLYARSLVRQNLSFDAIVDKVEQLVPKTLAVFSVDNLDTLERGGRISKAKAFFGKMLGVRPILAVQNGTGVIEPVTTVKSTEAAHDFMAKLAIEHYQHHGLAYGIGVMHTEVVENCQALKQKVAALGSNLGTISDGRIGGVVGCHLGPTGWGVVVC